MKLKITVENKTYEVDVEVAEPEAPTNVRYIGGGSGGHSSPAAAPTAPRADGAGKQPSSEAKACRSPLAGVVSEVQVKAGDAVESDQSVIVLEAMKMFTTITSPAVGKVKSVEVAVGDSVKQGQLLIEFE